MIFTNAGVSLVASAEILDSKTSHGAAQGMSVAPKKDTIMAAKRLF